MGQNGVEGTIDLTQHTGSPGLTFALLQMIAIGEQAHNGLARARPHSHLKLPYLFRVTLLLITNTKDTKEERCYIAQQEQHRDKVGEHDAALDDLCLLLASCEQLGNGWQEQTANAQSQESGILTTSA